MTDPTAAAAGGAAEPAPTKLRTNPRLRDFSRKTSKLIHTLAAAGMIGGLAAYGAFMLALPAEATESYAAMREMVHWTARHLIIPALWVALISGLLSMIVHRAFLEFRWVWLKAVLGLVTVEGTILVIGGATRDVAVAARKVVEGEAPISVLDTALAGEWRGLIAIMVLAVVQVILGVWRPRLISEKERRLFAALDARSAKKG